MVRYFCVITKTRGDDDSPRILGVDESILVELGGAIPSQVALESAGLNLAKCIREICLRAHGVIHGVDEFMRLRAVERPSVSGAVEGIVLKHGVA